MNFNPESCGIPYSEPAKLYAKMDINDRTRKHKLEQAKAVFSDLRDFFDSEQSQNYLTTIIKPQDVLLILEELENCFLQVEDYEKCEKIKLWRRKIERNLPPDLLFDHLY
jgi:hypothetical protein